MKLEVCFLSKLLIPRLGMKKVSWQQHKLARIGMYSSETESQCVTHWILKSFDKPCTITTLDALSLIKPWPIRLEATEGEGGPGGFHSIRNFSTWLFGFVVVRAGDSTTLTDKIQLPEGLEEADPAAPSIVIIEGDIEPTEGFLVTDIVSVEPSPSVGYETAGTTGRSHMHWRGYEDVMPGDRLVFWCEHDDYWKETGTAPVRDWFEVDIRVWLGFNGAYIGGETDSK